MVLVDEKKASRAQQRMSRLVRLGKIQRPAKCSQCGKEGYIRAHHNDYDKPLEVVWLCGTCHSKLECPTHKPQKRGHCNDGRGNRTKTERNQKIWALWENGWRQIAIAKMYKMTESAVSMVIMRERKRRR